LINISNGTSKPCGITQDPNTKNYIIVFKNYFCEKCDKKYTDLWEKWCQQCQINNLKEKFANCWTTSGNEEIDNLIQEKQLKVKHHNDIIFEWIPYNHFAIINKIDEGSYGTTYLAIWMNGLLQYNNDKKEYERMSNIKVALKCLHDSQNITNEFLNEV